MNRSRTRSSVAVLCLVVCGVAAGEDEFRLPEVDLGQLRGRLLEEAQAAQRRARERPDDPQALGMLGALYLAHDSPEAASVCLRRAVAIDPGTMSWHYYLGLALAETGDVGAAVASFERAAAADPDYAPAYVRQGDLLLEIDSGRAGLLYRAALSLDPSNATAHAGLGKSARMEGRYDEALDHFTRAIALAPGYAEAHYAMAMILAGRGRQDEARKHLAAHAAGAGPALDRDPLYLKLIGMGRTAGTLRRDAERLSQAGRLEEAAALLERAIAVDVSASTSRVHLGLVRARQGRLDDAVEQFRMVLESDPADVEARSSLGLALADLGRYDEAMRTYSDVLERHPDHAPTLMYMGRLLERMGRDVEALEMIRRGVRLQPANGMFQRLLGELLARAGDDEEAIEHLRKSTLLAPGDARARYTLGVLMSRANRLEEASAEWEEAVRLDPSLADAWLGLAGIALVRGEADEAVQRAERGCELAGYASRVCLYTLAKAYRAAGRPEDADRLENGVAQQR